MGHTLEAPVVEVEFSRDGVLALTGAWDGVARLWDVTTGREIRQFAGPLIRLTGVTEPGKQARDTELCIG
jgi:WD40 repeat protein